MRNTQVITGCGCWSYPLAVTKRHRDGCANHDPDEPGTEDWTEGGFLWHLPQYRTNSHPPHRVILLRRNGAATEALIENDGLRTWIDTAYLTDRCPDCRGKADHKMGCALR